MADPFTDASQLAVLQAGRAPVWSTLDADDALLPPSSGISGVALQGACRTLVHVALREDAAHRSARLTVPTPDLTCIYTVVVDSSSAAYDATAGAAADLQDILDGIAAAITSAMPTLVTATVVDADGDGVDDTVLVEGVGEADFAISFKQSSSAVIALAVDPVEATLRAWWLLGARVGSTAPAVWAWDRATLETIERRGYVERFDSAGFDRFHVQLTDRHGHQDDGTLAASVAPTLTDPVISIGPCLAEEE